MKVQLIKIAIETQVSDALLAAAHNAGQVVGRREVRRANLYLTSPNGVHDFITTFDQTMPSPYALLLASIRWSPTQGKYVTVANALLEATIMQDIGIEIAKGLTLGIEAWDDANKIIDDIEALKGKVLAEANSDAGRSAWFAKQEDAELWAVSLCQGNPYTVKFVSLEADDMVHAIVGKIKDQTGEALDGIYKGFIPEVVA